MNNPFGQMQNLMQSFQRFKQSFSGNPNQQIQQLMNSGKITQADYNKAVQMANQFRGMFMK